MYLGATWSKGITTKPKIQFKPSRGNRTMQVLATFLDQRKLAYYQDKSLSRTVQHELNAFAELC